MTNFFLEELRKIYGDGRVIHDPQFVGECCYAEAKAVLDACGISRQALTKEKADIYEQLAQLNKQIRAERQKIKLCRAIADSAAVIQRDVTAQEKALHEKETEHSFTNRR